MKKLIKNDKIKIFRPTKLHINSTTVETALLMELICFSFIYFLRCTIKINITDSSPVGFIFRKFSCKEINYSI